MRLLTWWQRRVGHEALRAAAFLRSLRFVNEALARISESLRSAGPRRAATAARASLCSGPGAVLGELTWLGAGRLSGGGGRRSRPLPVVAVVNGVVAVGADGASEARARAAECHARRVVSGSARRAWRRSCEQEADSDARDPVAGVVGVERRSARDWVRRASSEQQGSRSSLQLSGSFSCAPRRRPSLLALLRSLLLSNCRHTPRTTEPYRLQCLTTAATAPARRQQPMGARSAVTSCNGSQWQEW